MSSVETFDGLCGIIQKFSTSDLQLRCTYRIGHDGDCSWANVKNYISIGSHCGLADPNTCSHSWTNPNDSTVIVYSTVIGNGKYNMKYGETYVCRNCFHSINVHKKEL